MTSNKIMTCVVVVMVGLVGLSKAMVFFTQYANPAVLEPSHDQAYVESTPLQRSSGIATRSSGHNRQSEDLTSYESLAATSTNAYCQSASLDYPPGTLVTIVCPTGYELVGTDSSTCNARGYWSSGGVGFCRRRAAVKHCETPTTPENSFVTDSKSHGDRYFSGDYIVYECNEGFAFEEGENGRIQCHPSGFWSDEVPSCKRIRKVTEAVRIRKCYEPALPPHVHIVGQDSPNPDKEYSADETLKWMCNEGFEKTGGDDIITCLSDGSWSGGMVICQRLVKVTEAPPPVHCLGPLIPENAYIVEQSRPLPSNKFNIGSYITYDCIYDYVMTGNKTVQCAAGGKWSSEVPACKPMDKPTPAPPPSNKPPVTKEARSDESYDP